MTPIEEARAAIQAGETGALESLLKRHPDVVHGRTRDNDRTLLHTLTDYPGHWPNAEATARLLVDAGADVNARFRHPRVEHCRETPLHWTASCDDVAVAEILIDAGADLDADGGIIANGTPAFNAVIFLCRNVVNLLIDRGAAVNLMIAAGAGRRDLVPQFFGNDGKVLGGAGASPAWEKPRDPVSALNSAFGLACRNGHPTVAAFLLDRGADPTWKNPAGETAFEQANNWKQKIVVDWLRERGYGS